MPCRPAHLSSPVRLRGQIICFICNVVFMLRRGSAWELARIPDVASFEESQFFPRVRLDPSLGLSRRKGKRVLRVCRSVQSLPHALGLLLLQFCARRGNAARSSISRGLAACNSNQQSVSTSRGGEGTSMSRVLLAGETGDAGP